MTLSGRDFSGEEVQQYGIVNRALADDELRAYVNTLARRIALRPAHAIAFNRDVIRRTFASMADSLFEGFAAENDAMRAAGQQDYLQRANEALIKRGQKYSAAAFSGVTLFMSRCTNATDAAGMFFKTSGTTPWITCARGHSSKFFFTLSTSVL